ncbi:MAG: ketopantoate reductase C-terminal domain-containing protein, partial [Paracoccaceae bacterium]|nr:ketopantoate reductase C-terminal domain-containing protein [Paracoccaceae bacterium]
ARAECPALPASLGEDQFNFYQSIDGQVRASMCTDFLNGRKLELDWFSGELTRKARGHGIATPVHDVALAALWPYRNGAV